MKTATSFIIAVVLTISACIIWDINSWRFESSARNLRLVGLEAESIVYKGSSQDSLFVGGESLNLYRVRIISPPNCSSEDVKNMVAGQSELLVRHGFKAGMCVVDLTDWPDKNQAVIWSGNMVAVFTTF